MKISTREQSFERTVKGKESAIIRKRSSSSNNVLSSMDVAVMQSSRQEKRLQWQILRSLGTGKICKVGEISTPSCPPLFWWVGNVKRGKGAVFVANLRPPESRKARPVCSVGLLSVMVELHHMRSNQQGIQMANLQFTVIGSGFIVNQLYSICM